MGKFHKNKVNIKEPKISDISWQTWLFIVITNQKEYQIEGESWTFESNMVKKCRKPKKN